MRRLIAPVLFLALFALLPAACKRKNPPEVSDEQSMPLAVAADITSVLPMSDPHTDVQLVQGFYGLEAKTWRWTKKDFTVQLKSPAGAAQNGATLSFAFNIPASAKSVLPLTLTATVNGVAVPPQSFSKDGNFAYTRSVAGTAMADEVATVAFSLDKAVPTSGTDTRELGLIATSVGLTTVGSPTK